MSATAGWRASASAIRLSVPFEMLRPRTAALTVAGLRRAAWARSDACQPRLASSRLRTAGRILIALKSSPSIT